MVARLGVQIEFVAKRVGESAFPGQAIEVGRLVHPAAVGADRVRGMIVAHDEEDVRPGRRLRAHGAGECDAKHETMRNVHRTTSGHRPGAAMRHSLSAQSIVGVYGFVRRSSAFLSTTRRSHIARFCPAGWLSQLRRQLASSFASQRQYRRPAVKNHNVSRSPATAEKTVGRTAAVKPVWGRMNHRPSTAK